ncbi:MAG TPA: phosphoribosylglycinamide formyltransferase [bacterium]|nr:phosphoribosylglycinamide formyltransferase [bacterium]HQC50297.1 phosphoribosylglycinamide formyltransferase [bacterium]
MKKSVIPVGVLASGNGSNLQALIDACESGSTSAKIAVVISDKGDAHALKRAEKHRIPNFHLDRKAFDSRRTYEGRIVEILRQHKVELVCLAGYMKIVGETILGAFKDRVMNIHPALLPSFPGLDGQKQAFDYGVKIAGCTVHFVDAKVDHGPIICQAALPVMDDDTLETLKARILGKEHEIYPKAVALFADNRLKIEGRRVYILPKKVLP